MSTEQDDISMDVGDLYSEKSYTDRKVGTIRELTPVNADGTTDINRTVIYIGQSQMLTPMGALPITFEIPATSLADAVEKFAEGAKEAVEQTLKELQELRRESASSIVIPGADVGNKIQLR